MTIALAHPVKVALDKLAADGYGVDAFDAAGARHRGRAVVKDPSDLSRDLLYQRPSNKAKALDDMSNLVDWKAGRSALGVARNPDLARRIAEAITDADDFEQKRDLRELADEAADFAGASEGRDYGSLVHALLEAATAGADWKSYLGAWDDRDTVVAAVENAQQAMIDHGLAVLRTEVAVVNESNGCAGSTDALVAVVNDALEQVTRIVDYKTTKPTSLKFAWLGFGLQLWTYANADCIYDPHTGHRERFPDDFDPTTAYVVHVRWRDCETDIYELDLVPFGEAMRLVYEVEQWRGTAHHHVRRADKKVTQMHKLDSMAHLRLRIQELVDNGHGNTLKARWPEGVSIAPGQPSPSVDAVNAIKAALDEVEAAAGRVVPASEWDGLRHVVAHWLGEDLQLEFKRWYAATGWNDAHHPTRGQVTAIAAKLDELQTIARERSRPGLAALDLLTVDPALASAVRRAVCFDDTKPVEAFTPLQLRALEALVAAAQAEVVFPTESGEGLVFMAKALAGAKGVTKVAQPIAAEYGFDKPKKADDVPSNPVLAALTWKELVA